MIKHIILDLILFLVIILCPWWFGVILAVFLLFYLRFFYEIVLFGLMIDIYYGDFSSGFNFFAYRFMLSAIVLLLMSFYLKRRLKFYSK
jgi:hypothetical protein